MIERSLVPLRKPIVTRKEGQSQSGQIVIEYVLLLIIAIGLAALITSTMVRNDESNPGIVLNAWTRILDAIGSDQADEVQTTN